MKKSLTFLLLAFLLLSFCTEEPRWKTQIDGKANWLMVTPIGTVIVSTYKSLVCLNVQEQKIIWQVPTKGDVPKENFIVVPGTTLATFESSTGTKIHTTIIDYLNGKIAYNSKEEEVTIVNKTPLLDIGAIALEIRLEKKIYLSLIDIESGKERWRTELPGRKTTWAMGQFAIAPRPVTDVDGNILVPDNQVLKRFDANSGTMLWSKEAEKTIKRLDFSDDGNIIYVGAGQKISALSLKNGNDLWKNPLKISRDFETFVPSDEKSMYVVTTYDITLVNKETGEALWPKPIAFVGPFKRLHFHNRGLVVFGGSEAEAGFQFIDFNGNKIWKHAFSTAPVIDYKIMEKGILFATADEANMISFDTGDDSIWKKRIKLREKPITYIDDKIALVYSDGKLYRVDLTTLSYIQVNAEIKFKGDDEDVTKIELLDNGYLLTSSQNMWLIKPDGTVEYKVYYRPASVGTGMKILGKLAQVAATAHTLEAEQDPNDSNSITIKRSKTGDAIVGGIGSMIANRKNSFATQKAKYIMTRIDDGENKAIGMVKVEKSTGKELGKIVVNALDPIYEIDNATGELFIISNEKMDASCAFSVFNFVN